LRDHAINQHGRRSLVAQIGEQAGAVLAAIKEAAKTNPLAGALA